MMRLLLILVLSFQLQADWHRASKEECDVEYKRQLRWMGEAGWIGDPPISLGTATFFVSKEKGLTGYDVDQCGYTDGNAFRPITTVIGDGLKCEIDNRRLLMDRKRRGRLFKTLYFSLSNSKLEKYIKMCRDGKLKGVE